eukprot:10192603-Alexandrium_andersonii.AAC.1
MGTSARACRRRLSGMTRPCLPALLHAGASRGSSCTRWLPGRWRRAWSLPPGTSSGSTACRSSSST